MTRPVIRRPDRVFFALYHPQKLAVARAQIPLQTRSRRASLASQLVRCHFRMYYACRGQISFYPWPDKKNTPSPFIIYSLFIGKREISDPRARTFDNYDDDDDVNISSLFTGFLKRGNPFLSAPLTDSNRITEVKIRGLFHSAMYVCFDIRGSAKGYYRPSIRSFLMRRLNIENGIFRSFETPFSRPPS